MIQLTLEDGNVALFNEKHVVAVTPCDEEPHLTDVYVGELCIPAQESVGEILALIQMKFD